MKRIMKKTLICCSLITVLFLNGCSGLSAINPDQNKSLPAASSLAESKAEKPKETGEFSGVKVTCDNAVAFRFDDLDFQFAIVTLNVQSDQATNISLSHFKTSEGIVLDQVDSYVEKLEKQSYFLGRQSVWFSLISEDPTYQANIFVPVIDKKADSVTIIKDFGEEKEMTVSLKKTGDRQMLTYHAEDIISDGKSYQLVVSEAYEITGDYLYRNTGGMETEYLLPSTTKVYAFKIDAVSLWGDTLVIEAAKYIPGQQSEEFEAMDASVRSMKYANILGQPIQEKSSGYLLFYAYDPDDHPVSYTGILKLKLKDKEQWIDIAVNLN